MAFRALFLTSGPSVPSTRYRILPYLPYLRSSGIECDVWHSNPEKYQPSKWFGWRIGNQMRKLRRQLELRQSQQQKYDAIIIERELFDNPSVQFEEAFRQLTPRLILDLDDAIFLRYPKKFPRLAGLCDTIIAGNRLLAEESSKYCQDVRTIPTALDLNEVFIKDWSQKSSPPVVGWIGTAANLKYLDLLAPALERLNTQHLIQLRIISSLDADLSAWKNSSFPVELCPWSAETASADLSKFDVGLMPLPDEPWEQYKCGFKLLQYLAAQVPAVASPVGVNREIIEHGRNGWLATSPEEYVSSILQILERPDRGQQIAAAGRNTIEQNYSIAKLSDQFAAAIRGK